VEDLKDPLIGNLVLACQISDAFTTRVAGAYLLVAVRFGEVFRENGLGGTGNTMIEEVKHTLDSSVHGGYTGDVEALQAHLMGTDSNMIREQRRKNSRRFSFPSFSPYCAPRR
jgi:hypothetical protein